MWERSHKYAGHHWSMSIDMNLCNGCGACIAACNIENNVPLVGKDEVAKGREMFWLRIDRYYRGTPESPDFVQQAVLCQHCGNASCETVCPVIATMHNDEGLNVMAYNRCVGTRYCANNCPYKVRRFNFWQYSDYRTGPYDNVARVSPMELVLNPDVSTRSRGVMEKCSFCNHRIRVAKDKARDAGRPLQDGEMLTACQQTCPAKAIHFGDRNDQHAQISKDWVNPRAYALLQDLNNDPSIRYMTLVRNRDEKSPYRTKYQSHREDHGHGDQSNDDHGHDHEHDHSNDKQQGAAAGSHDAHH
jgi:Fe-S-cluster-containing dehydrogenase component